MNTLWQFDTFAFPIDSLPNDGGDWNQTEKLIRQEPLVADVSVLTSMGFQSDDRTIQGECSRTFRDQMKTMQRSRTVGALVDGEGRSVIARIVRTHFDPVALNKRFRYAIDFTARV